MRDRMAEAGSSALKLVDEQAQQNIRFFEAVLGLSQEQAKPSKPIKRGQRSRVQGE